MNLLPDTCTFLWLTLDSADLSENARQLFRDPANSVFFSVISAWEISVKHGLGKLPLPEPVEDFLPRRRELYRIETLALDEAAVLQLPKLPRIHTDPFDRMLICQAIAHGLTLLTPDPMIKQYPVRTIW